MKYINGRKKVNFMDREQLELLRKKAVKKITIGAFIAIMVGLVVLITTFNIRGAFVLTFLSSITIILAISHKDVSKFKDSYKKTIILEIFKNLFTDLQYEPKHGISRSTLESTNMIDTGDRFFSDDYMKAKYKNVFFEFSDVKIQEEHTGSDGETHIETVFNGQWYIFDFNKSFKADLQVCEKGFRNAKRESLFEPKKFSKVELEDIEFNKEFNVYAQNSLDAFYVLTPGTMTKIKELNYKVKGKMLFCFINNRLHVGLHSGKNLFEPQLFKEINIEENHKQAIEEVKMITHFIDVLDLDNDLFRKGV